METVAEQVPTTLGSNVIVNAVDPPATTVLADGWVETVNPVQPVMLTFGLPFRVRLTVPVL